jgi:tRNA (guanine37-N1)-methyltransferase
MRKPTYDILGSIAIVKFDREDSEKEKKEWSRDFIEKNKHIQTILEKADKIKGRLRIAKTKFIAGQNVRETIYNENQCRFKLNVDETYFSPRLSNERKIIAEDISEKITRKKNKVLVMFAGVAPFPVVIAKQIKQKGKQAVVISNEINRKACKYAEQNVLLNKVGDFVKVVQCDAKNLPVKLKSEKMPLKYDFIMMARPNLKDTFLETALKLSKKGTKIYYHGFGTEEKVRAEIQKDAGKKIGKVLMRKAGEIKVREFRWLANFQVK